MATRARRSGALGWWCLVAGLGMCRAQPYPTTGEIVQYMTSPPNCLLVPRKDGDPPSCANCSLQFDVESNVTAPAPDSNVTVQYRLTSTSLDSGECTCPPGFSEPIDPDGEDVDINFNESTVTMVSNGVSIELFGTTCTVFYNVTKGTVLNISATTGQIPVPSSDAVETFAIVLLFVSAVSILAVFIGAYRSQTAAVNGYSELDG